MKFHNEKIQACIDYFYSHDVDKKEEANRISEDIRAAEAFLKENIFQEEMLTTHNVYVNESLRWDMDSHRIVYLDLDSDVPARPLHETKLYIRKRMMPVFEEFMQSCIKSLLGEA